jgi:hypothetical protein
MTSKKKTAAQKESRRAARSEAYSKARHDAILTVSEFSKLPQTDPATDRQSAVQL